MEKLDMSVLTPIVTGIKAILDLYSYINFNENIQNTKIALKASNQGLGNVKFDHIFSVEEFLVKTWLNKQTNQQSTDKILKSQYSQQELWRNTPLVQKADQENKKKQLKMLKVEKKIRDKQIQKKYEELRKDLPQTDNLNEIGHPATNFNQGTFCDALIQNPVCNVR